MASGWKRKQVIDLCDFVNGHGFKASEWSEQGLPIIRIQNLNGSKEFNYYDGTPPRGNIIVEPGDILFAWAGVKGVSFGPKIWAGPRGLLNQHIFKIIPSDRVDTFWLYSVLRMITAKIEASAHGFKSSLLHIKKADIAEHPVYAPEIDEQQAITKVLSTWDRAIEKTEALIAAKEKRKKCLMQQLLTGRVRFRACAGKEWGAYRLRSFLTESRVPGTNGAIAKKITVKLYGKGVVEKVEKMAGSKSTKYYKRSAGQFIYSKLDFLNGAFGIIPKELDSYETTLDLPCFDFKVGIVPAFLLAYVQRTGFYTQFEGSAIGGRKAKRISSKEFLNLSIKLPPINEQRKIVAVLQTVIAEIQAHRNELKAIQAQKKWLMQQLLTGKVRVKVN